jgi:signal transduction histidine kinase
MAAVGHPGMAQRADLDLDQLQHTAYGVNEGAPSHPGVMSQDRDGFLWITSGEGFTRFDGVRFDNPYADVLAAYPPVFQQFVDAQDNIWLGHQRGGVTVLDHGRARHSVAGQDGLPVGSVFGFLQDEHGIVWAISTGGVVRWIDGHWQRVGVAMGYPGTHPESLFRDKASGSIYLQDADGSFVLHPGATRFEVTHEDLDHIQIPLPDSINWHFDQTTDGDALIDRGGALWVVGDSGVDRLRWPGEPPGKLPPSREHASRATGLTSDSANNLFEDREGDVWLSTEKGLDRFRVTALTPVHLPGNVSSPSLAIAADGNVWVASAFEPPMELHGAAITPHPEWDRWNGKGGDSAMLATADGLWMAGSNGLRHGSGNKLEKLSVPPELAKVGTRYRSLTRDGAGNVWVAISTYGVYRIVQGQWQAHGGRDDLPPGDPAYLTTDARGRVWLAYPGNRLAMVDGRQLTLYTAADGLALGDVFDVAFRDDRVWITGSRGVALLRDGHFRTLEGSGEAFAHASGVVETARGDVWISTTHGIFQIGATAMAAWRSGATAKVPFRRFGIADGMEDFPPEGSIPSLVQAHDGRLWFAGSGSIAFVDPDHVRHNDVVPQPVIEAVTADGRSFPVTADFTLPPLTSRVDVQFTAAALRMPERVRVEYRLDGIDADWQEAGTQRSVSYARLPPGHYSFRVRAFNEDGVASTNPAVLRFSLAPAWYQTWWFRMACVLAAIALLWLLHRWRVRRAEQRARAEHDVRAAERERIARDLHDTLLQSVQGMLLQIETSVGADDTPARTQRLQAAVCRARDSVVEARDKIAALRGEDDKELSLSSSLGGLGRHLASDHAIRFSQLAEGSEAKLRATVREEVFLIGSELLRNAFVHAAADHVQLRVACESRQLVLAVRDDGRGIDPQVLAAGGCPGHWGLTGTRERAAELGGRIVFRCDGNGTVATLTVPAALAYQAPG